MLCWKYGQDRLNLKFWKNQSSILKIKSIEDIQKYLYCNEKNEQNNKSIIEPIHIEENITSKEVIELDDIEISSDEFILPPASQITKVLLLFFLILIILYSL